MTKDELLIQHYSKFYEILDKLELAQCEFRDEFRSIANAADFTEISKAYDMLYEAISILQDEIVNKFPEEQLKLERPGVGHSALNRIAELMKTYNIEGTIQELFKKYNIDHDTAHEIADLIKLIHYIEAENGLALTDYDYPNK